MRVSPFIRTSGPSSLGYWLIVLSVTLSYTVNSACAPLIAYTTAHDLGSTTSTSGIIVSSAIITSLICMILTGKVTDRTGPHNICFFAEITGILALVGPAISCSIPILFANRILYGAANAVITVASTIWVAYNIPSSQKGRAFAYYGISVWIGLALGPIISETTAQSISTQYAWALLALMQTVSCLLLLPVQGTVRKNNHIEKTDHINGGLSTSVRLLRRCALPCCIALIGWGVEGAITTFLIQHLTQYGVPDTGLLSSSSLFGVLAVSVITCRILVGDMPDRHGSVITTAICMSALGWGCILLAFSHSLFLGTLSMVAIGFSYSPLYPSLTLLTTQLASKSSQSMALGIFSASTSAGYYCGAFTAGILIENLSSTVTFLLLGCLPFLCLPVLFLKKSRKESHAE